MGGGVGSQTSQGAYPHCMKIIKHKRLNGLTSRSKGQTGKLNLESQNWRQASGKATESNLGQKLGPGMSSGPVIACQE